MKKEVFKLLNFLFFVNIYLCNMHIFTLCFNHNIVSNMLYTILLSDVTLLILLLYSF